jgi:hypothetical protein
VVNRSRRAGIRNPTRFETLAWLAARSPTSGLAQIAPVDLDIPVLGQLAPLQLPLGDALEPGPLMAVPPPCTAPGWPLGQEALGTRAAGPDAAVLPDLDPELQGLMLSVPSAVPALTACCAAQPPARASGLSSRAYTPAVATFATTPTSHGCCLGVGKSVETGHLKCQPSAPMADRLQNHAIPLPDPRQFDILDVLRAWRIG